MNELQKIEKLLDENFIPKEVWIGTNSTADRVDWVLRRKKLKEETASKRFNTFADEFMILAVIENFQKEDLTIDEIVKRSGLEREIVKKTAEYLAQKGLLLEYNDGFKGMVYGVKENEVN